MTPSFSVGLMIAFICPHSPVHPARTIVVARDIGRSPDLQVPAGRHCLPSPSLSRASGFESAPTHCSQLRGQPRIWHTAHEPGLTVFPFHLSTRKRDAKEPMSMGEQSYGPPASASIANAPAAGAVRDHGGGLDAAETRFGKP